MRRFAVALLLVASLGACSEEPGATDPVFLPPGLTLEERCQTLQDFFDRAEFNGDPDEMAAINEQMEREGCYG